MHTADIYCLFLRDDNTIFSGSLDHKITSWSIPADSYSASTSIPLNNNNNNNNNNNTNSTSNDNSNSNDISPPVITSPLRVYNQHHGTVLTSKYFSLYLFI